MTFSNFCIPSVVLPNYGGKWLGELWKTPPRKSIQIKLPSRPQVRSIIHFCGVSLKLRWCQKHKRGRRTPASVGKWRESIICNIVMLVPGSRKPFRWSFRSLPAQSWIAAMCSTWSYSWKPFRSYNLFQMQWCRQGWACLGMPMLPFLQAVLGTNKLSTPIQGNAYYLQSYSWHRTWQFEGPLISQVLFLSSRSWCTEGPVY